MRYHRSGRPVLFIGCYRRCSPLFARISLGFLLGFLRTVSVYKLLVDSSVVNFAKSY